MSRTLKALSALLTYPTAELQAAAAEIATVLAEERADPGGDRAPAVDAARPISRPAISTICRSAMSLLFDRTRSLSLHLFEHVHGESRDRGQAMVDLKSHLSNGHGFELERGRAARLPAAVPGVPLDRGRSRRRASLLGQPAHILAAHGGASAQAAVGLRSRLPGAGRARGGEAEGEEVAALLELAGSGRDDLAALDAAWEDEPVTFRPRRQRRLQGRPDGARSADAAPAPDMPPDPYVTPRA